MTEPELESRRALHELIALLQEIDERYLGDEWGRAGVRRHRRRLPQRRQHDRGRLLPDLRHRPGAAVLPADRQPQPQDARRQPRRALLHGAGAGRPLRTGSPATWPGRSTSRSRSSWARPTAATAPRPRACSATATSTSRPTAASRCSSAATRATATGSGWPTGASELIVRCYFEEAEPVAADPNRIVPLDDRAARAGRSAARRGTTTSVAAGYRRAAQLHPQPHARAGQARGAGAADVGVETPNEFPPPELPGDFAFAAADAAYSMAPYVLGPDEALVMTGRWPECALRQRVGVEPVPPDLRLRRTGPAGRNRANTTLEPDGSLPHRHRPRGPRRAELDRHRRAGRSAWCSGASSCPRARSRRPVATVVKVADLRWLSSRRRSLDRPGDGGDRPRRTSASDAWREGLDRCSDSLERRGRA